MKHIVEKGLISEHNTYTCSNAMQPGAYLNYTLYYSGSIASAIFNAYRRLDSPEWFSTCICKSDLIHVDEMSV